MIIPHFAPPLQGRLVVCYSMRAGLFRDMVHSFGEIRFGTMSLFNVRETQLLLRACAKTLQVLQLNPFDRFGE